MGADEKKMENGITKSLSDRKFVTVSTCTDRDDSALVILRALSLSSDIAQWFLLVIFDLGFASLLRVRVGADLARLECPASFVVTMGKIRVPSRVVCVIPHHE